jgi:predicted enzyme related to lactoylglutathione lyase
MNSVAEACCEAATMQPLSAIGVRLMGSPKVAHQVVWFDIPCRNLDRAIAFYTAVLGSPVEKQSMGEFSMGVLPHEGDSVGGCLAVMDDNPPSDHGVLIYLNCNGRLDDAIDAVEPGGGEILLEKHSIGPYGYRDHQRQRRQPRGAALNVGPRRRSGPGASSRAR